MMMTMWIKLHLKGKGRIEDTYLKSYPCNCCITSGAILCKINTIHSFNSHTYNGSQMENYNKRGLVGWYQQGVPTKVFLERCLSPVSNIHADTPKSASLTAPLESSRIFPACMVKNN